MHSTQVKLVVNTSEGKQRSPLMPVWFWFLMTPIAIFILLIISSVIIHFITLPFHPQLDLSKNAFFDHPAIESYSSALLAPFMAVMCWSLLAPFLRIGAAILTSSCILAMHTFFSKIDFEPPPPEVIPLLDGLSIIGYLAAIAIIAYIDRKSLKTMRI